MLLGGNAVTPIDWWSEQWVNDRVMRKFIEAGAPADGSRAATGSAESGPLARAAEPAASADPIAAAAL